MSNPKSEPSLASAWRPTLQQLLELTGGILEIPVSELATPEIMRRARHALSAPNAEVHGCELYPEIPQKAAALVGALLADPPPGRQAPRIACQALRGFLRRNGWEWSVSVPATIIRFESELRSGEIGLGLATWIEMHTVAGTSDPAAAKPSNWMPLFAADNFVDAHIVYQGGPVAGLDRTARLLQIELGKGLEEAVADASQQTGSVMTVEHPSVRLSTERRPDASDYDIWQWNRMLMLSKADALVVADIGDYGPGVGAGMEIDLMAAQGGPILYLRREGRGPCSRYISGRSDELDLSIFDYRSPAEAADHALAWLVDRVGAIEEAGRRRVDRVYEGELLLKRLRPAYRALEPDRKTMICGRLCISPTLVEAALEHPAATGIVLGQRQTTFCELVGLEEGVSGDRVAEAIPNSPRADTLIEASKRMGWGAEKIQKLWSEAVHEWETVTVDLRFPAQSVTDWIERGRN